MTLFEIDRKIAELLEYGFNEECIDEETGEFFPDRVWALLEQYEGERNTKLENVALYVKSLTAEADAIKAEEKALADRRKAKEKRVESLKQYLTNALELQGKFETPRVSLSFRKSVSVEVDTKVLGKEWMTEKIEYSPDKAALRLALKAGTEIAGAQLIEKQNLQIK